MRLKRYLFVGGPLDGDHRHVDVELDFVEAFEFIWAPVLAYSSDPNIATMAATKILYRKVICYDKDKPIEIFVSSDVQETGLLTKLVQGYRKDK